MVDATEVTKPYNKMNPEVKAEWLEALRSGNYAQATGRLCKVIDRTTDDPTYGYCCLGVLTDLYRKDTNIGKWIADGRGYYAGKDFHVGEEEIFRASNDIPVATRSWSNLTDEFARSELVKLNDGDKKTFSEIADWIEENL